MLGDRMAMAENRKCIRIRFSGTAECVKHHMDTKVEFQLNKPQCRLREL